MRRARQLLSFVALALFALTIVVAGGWTVQRSCERLGRFLEHGRETPFGERSRRFGPVYTDAIGSLRDAISPRETYLLVDRGDLIGAENWVRYELAPRPAIFLGRWADLPSGSTLRKAFPRDARKVVIAGKVPRLLDRYQFLQELADRDR